MKNEARQRASKLIAELERHIQVLEEVNRHNAEIALCQEAIENLKDILSTTQD